MDATLLDHV